MSKLGIPLMGTDPKDWKWVQVAEVGRFKGHSAGEFELNSDVFDQVVKNFLSRDIPIPWDFEHASEQDATSGSIPVTGAPAQGYIHRLENRGSRGLWALVEWGALAKQYIKAGQYKFCSPAIRFGSKDTVTGANVGARLTSVALTSTPFLSNMVPLAAKDQGAGDVVKLSGINLRIEDETPQLGQLRAARLFGLSDDAVTASEKGASVHGAFALGLAHHPTEYMPKIRACMGLHPTATAAECQDRLDTLRSHYDADQAGDRDGTNEGVKLSEHLLPFRDMFGDSSLGMTWADILDRVQDLIDASIDEHVADYHSGGASMTDRQPPATLTPATQTENDEMDPKLLKDAEDKAKASEEKAAALAAEKTALEATVKTLSDKVASTETLVKNAETANADLLEIVTAVGAVAMKDEAPKAVVLRLVEDNKKLLADKAARDEADLERDVQIAKETWQESRKLADKDFQKGDGKDKKDGWVMTLARTNRESFNETFPIVPENERVLLRTITPPEERPKIEKPVIPTSFSALTAKLMTDKGLDYAGAQVEASAILAGKKTYESIVGSKK